MTRKLRQRILRALSLALVGAALTAGAAQAGRPDDRGGMLGVGAVSASVVATTAVPDAFERAVTRSIGIPSTRPDDRGEARGPGVYFSVPPVPTGAISTDDFQWRDASAGAGAVLVLILFGAGIAVSVRHRGRAALS
jgi:hypothetical protein